MSGGLSMAKQRKLARTVYVDGVAYGPDDEVPAAVAEQITNPKAWAADKPAAEGAAEGEMKAGTKSGARLASHVHIGDRAYGPDDEVPDDVAAQITNPKAWEGGKLPPAARKTVDEWDEADRHRAEAEQQRTDAEQEQPTPGPASVTATSTTEVPAPPRSGRGSGVDAWAAFAAAQGVEVPAGASREDIVAACEAAKVIEPAAQ